MWRYLRLYKNFVKASIITDLQYRGSFFLTALMSLGWGLAYLLLYVFIFQFIDKVGDWTYEGVLILASTMLIVHALCSFLFHNGLKNFSYTVYEGDLDFILLKPLSSQFYISLRQFYLKPFLRFILAWLVLAMVLYNTNVNIAFWGFLIYIFLIIIATIIVYSLWFIICLSVFWLGNIENIYEFFHPILRITSLPFDIFPSPIKEIVFFVIPLVFIATIPAKALLGLATAPTILYGVFISLFLLFLSHKLWHLALKKYSSVSS